jgi:hypothetical protein
MNPLRWISDFKSQSSETSGSRPSSPTGIATERIRLFFPLPEEEQVAVALMGFLGPRAGAGISELTPDMTMGEVMDLSRDHLGTPPEFSQMLELAGIEAFDDQFEQMAFREFVRYSAGRRTRQMKGGARIGA